MSKYTLFTVGHSNQTVEEFLQLIEPYGVNCIIDVRSMPYSKYTPQFNQEALKAALQRKGILYAHFGTEFGARRTDCLVITDLGKKGTKEQVNFELGVKSPNFRHGVERLEKALSQGRTVSLMCSEANPLDCHRFSFLARFFYEQGWDVMHIMRHHDDIEEEDMMSVRESIPGRPFLRSHSQLEQDMIQAYVDSGKLKKTEEQSGASLFSFSDFGDNYNAEQQRIDAYRLKNHDIGWTPTETSEENEYEYEYNY